MQVMPFVMREMFDVLIWLLVVFYVLGRSGGVEFQVTNNLDEAKLDTYAQIFINNPNCFAYEQFNINYYNGTGSVNAMVSAGLIDITKFFDVWHQNCLRYSEIWSSITPLTDQSSLTVCATSGNCASGQECVSRRCMSALETPSENGLFLTYEVLLEDLSLGESYSFVSFDGLTGARYTPIKQGITDSNSGWDENSYFEYLSCKSDFVTHVYKHVQPVFIAYPKNEGTNEAPEKHSGYITITLCRGVYGTSTNQGDIRTTTGGI